MLNEKQIQNELKEIQARHKEAKKDFKNRALYVIQTLTSDDIICKDIEKLKSDIFKAAHCALGTCQNGHEDWKAYIEKLFKEFEKDGFI